MKENLLNKIEYIDFSNKEMIVNQLRSWELMLRKRELKQNTIDRKLRNIIGFYSHISVLKNNKIKITKDNSSSIAFEYVRDGYFSEENFDNEGTSSYRRSIYSDIREGFNFIYESHFEEDNIIKELTDGEKELLDDISRNKFFKITTKQNNDNYYDIQSKLIEDLGIQVYFDEQYKPYVLSHELAELIGKNNKDVMKSLRKILERFNERNFSPVGLNVDFTIIE